MRALQISQEEFSVLPISREVALASKSRLFFTGVPCVKGHRSARLTSNNSCLTCSRDKGKKAAEKRRRKQGTPLQRRLQPLPPNSKFHDLTATGRLVSRHNGKRNVWMHEVTCKCGKTYSLSNRDWMKARRCSVCDRQNADSQKKRREGRIAKSPVKGKSGTLEGRLYASARARAAKNGTKFSLAIEDIEIPSQCPILGIPLLALEDPRPGKRAMDDASPSLDRLDPNLGYTRENIAIMSARANSIKNDGSALEHLQIAYFYHHLKEGGLIAYELEDKAPQQNQITRRARASDTWTLEALQSLPKSRREALFKGSSIYFSGRLCKRNHLSPRRLDAKCSQCRNERDNARYSRENAHRKKVQGLDEILANRKLHLSCDEAIERNVGYFYPELICKRGHETVWRQDRGSVYCVECKRASAREYVARSHQKKERLGSYHSVMKYLLASAAERARKKNLEFAIKRSDLRCPEYCPVFGRAFHFDSNDQSNDARARVPSIDRTDSTDGYVPGNVLLTSYRANILKGQGTPSEHLQIGRYMHERMPEDDSSTLCDELISQLKGRGLGH